MTAKKKISTKFAYLYGLLSGLILAVLIFLIVLLAKNGKVVLQNRFFPTPTVAVSKPEDIIAEVLPIRAPLDIRWGDAITQMVKNGVIDKEKFIALYASRGGLSDADKKLLDSPSNEQIVITKENSNLLLNYLWGLGIANKTNVLSDGPMGTQYKSEVGNFSSTGGWTLGKFSGGELFNKYVIVTLTTDQEAMVKEMAQNIFRPCCGNSTYFPDCNHGAAMLAYLELAVSQGVPKSQIYKNALLLNSYWFPQTYAELAIYFKNTKNTPWSRVDPKVVLGADYSSNQGSVRIDKELQASGLVPKVTGAGGCGV